MGRIISVFSSDDTSTSIEEIKSWTVAPGGIAGLNAFALSKLGIPTAFVGCVGNDDTGLSLKNSLQQQGVDVQGIRVVSDSQTAWIWSLRHPNGDRSFHSPQLSLEHFADGQLSPFDLDPDWFEKDMFYIPQAGILGLENGRKAMLYGKELTERAQGTTFFDANFRRFAWQSREEAVELTTKFAKTSEFVQISIEDARIFFNVDSVKGLGNLLPKARGILMTQGAEGCQYLLDGNMGSSPGFDVPVFDSSLGGDAFFAAFISRLALYGVDSISDPAACEEFVRFANAAGALSVTKVRGPDAFPEVKDIEALLSLNDPSATVPAAANS
jgi:fructokinase